MIGFAVLINFSGLLVTLMDPDATRYATVAKTMVQRNDFLNLYCDGKDWLDKPHFPFWVTAVFFKFFGFKTWAYKLSGILFTLLGAVYTYLFAKRLYNREIALIAVLILLTAQHIVLSDNDVRAEPYLTGLIIAGVYHFYRAYRQQSFSNLVVASAFAACAVMTKGIFSLLPIAAAIAGELIIKKDWSNLFHWRWLVAAVFIFLFIFPELYALYIQFDLHPEKLVFGKTHVSGLQFFFWDSQFGRFENTGPIKGQGNPFYFFHTLLWAFLPWSLLLYAAVFATIKNNWKNALSQEWFCICGALFTFLIFSLSRFQLSYYLNIVFPFFAIIVAQYFYKLKGDRTIPTLAGVQVAIVGVMIIGASLLQFFFKPDYFSIPLSVGLLLLWLLVIFAGTTSRLSLKQKALVLPVLACFLVNLYLNLSFYPSLLRYQSGSEAARWINKNNPEHLPVYAYYHDYDLEFYLDQPIHYIDTANRFPYSLIYVKGTQQDSLASRKLPLVVARALAHYPVTHMTLPFINAKTRNKTLAPAGVFRYGPR